jgi:hypothetical protein
MDWNIVACMVVSAIGDVRLDASLDWIRSLAMALLCLNRNDSLPVSMIWQ